MYMRPSENNSYSPNKRISLKKSYKNSSSKTSGTSIKFNPVIHGKIKPGIFSYMKINSLEIANNLNKSNLIEDRQFYSRILDKKESKERIHSQSRNFNDSIKDNNTSFAHKTNLSKVKDVSPIPLINYIPSNIFDTSTSKLFINQLHELDSSRFKKRNSISKFVYCNDNEIDNRRMTIELVKIILKSNKLYNNFPLAVFKDMKLDESLLIPPNFFKNAHKENTNKRQAFSIPFLTAGNEETSPQKMEYLYFLIQPKIVHLSLNKNNSFEFFIFKLIPTSHLFQYKIDFYIIELESIRDPNENLTLNITEILSCSKKTNNSFLIGIDKKDAKEDQELEIKVESEEEASQYVTAINYISQLIKCKVYSISREVK